MARRADGSFAHRARVVTGIVALAAAAAALLVFHSYVPLMAFAGVVGAVLLDAAARPVERWLGIGRRSAVSVVTFGGLALLVAVGWAAGPKVAEQASGLTERVPAALNALERFLAERGWGRALLSGTGEEWNAESVEKAVGAVWKPIAGAFATLLAAASGGLLVAVVAFFLALEPRLYVDGLLHLARPERRPRWRELLASIAHALRWWLLARVVSMAAVAVLTLIGLFALGVPLATLLAIVAGLLSFIPYLGPLLGGVPAVLVGFAERPMLALWIALLYFGVQVVEGNLLTPLIEKRVVSMPPAVVVVAELAMGGVFGLLGLLVAPPLAVTAIVFVQAVYVRDVLGEEVALMGERPPQPGTPEPRARLR